MIKQLPADRTITFACDNQNSKEFACLTYHINFERFPASQDPVIVSIDFKFLHESLQKVFSDDKDIFLMQTTAFLENLTPDSSVKLLPNYPVTIVFAKATKSTPIWVYIVSILVGIVVLAGIAYGLYRFGFFRRHKKEELEREKRNTIQVLVTCFSGLTLRYELRGQRA